MCLILMSKYQENFQIYVQCIYAAELLASLLTSNWQSLSLDYQFLMLILLNHYMLIEFVWYLHGNKWLES